MTERRPAHEPVPDFVERQIVEAQARGEFDGLAGSGEPLAGIGAPDDELWWVRRKLKDEHVVDLPPALLARRDRDEALAAVTRAVDEVTVRRLVAEVNGRIAEINRTTFRGPPTSVGPLDVEQVVAGWRTANPDAPYDAHQRQLDGAEEDGARRDDAGRRRSRWWRRPSPARRRP